MAYKLRVKYNDNYIVNKIPVNSAQAKTILCDNKLMNGNMVVEIYQAGRLPDAYTELEYVYCNGNQYIDTGVTPDENIKIKESHMHTEHIIDTPLFGARTTYSYNSYTYWSHPVEATSRTSNLIFNGYVSTHTNFNQGTKITLEYSKSGYTVNGITGSFGSVGSGSPNTTLILMGLHNGSSVDTRRFAGNVYYFEIYSGTTAVRNFIPAKRNSDNVVGMYDLVNNSFYTNNGSGSFVAGPEVIY